jgi:hypothetical protein
MRRVGVRAVAVGGDELRDRFTMRRHDIAVSFADVAQEFREFTFCICLGYGPLRVVSSGNDTTSDTSRND